MTSKNNTGSSTIETKRIGEKQGVMIIKIGVIRGIIEGGRDLRLFRIQGLNRGVKGGRGGGTGLGVEELEIGGGIRLGVLEEQGIDLEAQGNSKRGDEVVRGQGIKDGLARTRDKMRGGQNPIII